MLLAGGGSKALSDFATASGVVTALGTNGNYVTWTKNGTANNLTIPYATTADTLKGTLIASKSTNTCYSNLNVKWYNNINGVGGYAGDNTGFPISNNASGLLWLGTHDTNYGG